MSGSFAPNTGFTYDQQLAPSAPSGGQTWQERDNNNNVAGQWFWNGTLWLSIRTFSCQYYNPGNTTLSATLSAAIIPFMHADLANVFILQWWFMGRCEADTSPGGGTDSATNYWTFDVFSIGANNSSSIAGSPVLSTQNRTYLQFRNVSLDSGAINTAITVKPSANAGDNGTTARSLAFTATRTGTPPNITRYATTVNYRLSRP
jgi:hypothetical protein